MKIHWYSVFPRKTQFFRVLSFSADIYHNNEYRAASRVKQTVALAVGSGIVIVKLGEQKLTTIMLNLCNIFDRMVEIVY